MQRKPPFTANLWCDDTLGSVELLRGSFTEFSFAPHAHDAACLALITRGAIRIRTRGAEFVTRRGDLFAVDVGEVHAGWATDEAGWSQRTIYAGLDTLQAAIREERQPRRTVAGPVITDRELATSLVRLHRSSERQEAPLRREEHYLAFAERLFQRHMRPALDVLEPGREPQAVRRAKEFLDHRIDERVSLTEIAAASGLPPFRLLRAFTRDQGLTPHAYQRQARLRQAMALMRRGETLGEVAVAAGFADQAHFTRTFRAAMGITPGAYRRARLGQTA